MATAELSRRVETVVGYPPPSDLDDLQRREFHEALLEGASFEDLSGKWQAAILKAEQNRPKLRVVTTPPHSLRRTFASLLCDRRPRPRRDAGVGAHSPGAGVADLRCGDAPGRRRKRAATGAD
jgi:hypothetical protein